jgi:hypothetical protein
MLNKRQQRIGGLKLLTNSSVSTGKKIKIKRVLKKTKKNIKQH